MATAFADRVFYSCPYDVSTDEKFAVAVFEMLLKYSGNEISLVGERLAAAELSPLLCWSLKSPKASSPPDLIPLLLLAFSSLGVLPDYRHIHLKCQPLLHVPGGFNLPVFHLRGSEEPTLRRSWRLRQSASLQVLLNGDSLAQCVQDI